MDDELKDRVKEQEKPPQWFVLLESVVSCKNEDVMVHLDGSMTIKPDCMERFAQAVARECAQQAYISEQIAGHFGNPAGRDFARSIADSIRARFGVK